MSHSTLSLKSFVRDGRRAVAVFDARHSTGGGNGTTLAFDVVLSQERDRGPWVATIQFEGCEGIDPRLALNRLASWCSRAAETMSRDDVWWVKGELPIGDFEV